MMASQTARHADSGAAPTARGKQYSTNVLMSALGISRGTLRYYEQLGIVNPSRDPESNYRTYSNADVFRVVECVMLKNAGYQVQQARDLLADPELDAAGYVDACLARSAWQLARAKATNDRLMLLRDVVGADFSAAPVLAVADEWLMHYDGCEGGYDQLAANEAQDALLGGMPVSSFAAVMDVDACEPRRVETRWGRAIPARYRDLLPGLESFPGEPERFGGCPCLTLPYRADEARIPGFDEEGSACARFAEALHRLGLRQAGPICAPCVLPVRGMVYTRLYLPVEPAGLRGRALLAGLRPRG